MMPVNAMTDPMERSKEPLMRRMVIPAAMIPLIVMWLNRLRKFLRVKKLLSAMLSVAIRTTMMTRSFRSAMTRRIFPPVDFIGASCAWSPRRRGPRG